MAVNMYMRLVVTCASDDPVIDEIYHYCQSHQLTMSCGRYIVVDDHYWIWRIDCEPSSAVTWLLIKWEPYLFSL